LIPVTTSRRTRLPLLALIALPLGARLARGDGPADGLLKIAPADAGITVVVEDLKTHARAFLGSPLARGLMALPAVREWRESGRGREFRKARGQIESILGADFASIRDGLLGDAVVLSLRVPPGGRPEDARGLLLTRASDRAMLDRAVRVFNEAQTKRGELRRVSERRRDRASYHVREFQAGGRPAEYYAFLSDGGFAWSNSEELLLGALDRDAGASGGLAGSSDFRRVREHLPAGAVVSAFVDPRFLESVAAGSERSNDPGEERVKALLGRYASAVRFAGAAIETRHGLVLHTDEVVDPERLPHELLRWGSSDRRPDASLMRVPPGALAFAVVSLDATVVYELLASLIPERERAKWDNLQVAIRGVMLGLDPRSAVAPQVGPGAALHVEPPAAEDADRGLSLVASLEIAAGHEGERASEALTNALRTWLAAYAMDDKQGGEGLHFATEPLHGEAVTRLAPRTPLAFAAAPRRLVIGSTPGAVARALAAHRERGAGARIERLRAAFFPSVDSFACADLAAVHEWADPIRELLARRMAERQGKDEGQAARDLDHALALIRLFDAAFVTSAVEPGFRGVHRSLGFVSVPRSTEK
jgi:hypothetical protein